VLSALRVCTDIRREFPQSQIFLRLQKQAAGRIKKKYLAGSCQIARMTRESASERGGNAKQYDWLWPV